MLNIIWKKNHGEIINLNTVRNWVGNHRPPKIIISRETEKEESDNIKVAQLRLAVASKTINKPNKGKNEKYFL